MIQALEALGAWRSSPAAQTTLRCCEAVIRGFRRSCGTGWAWFAEYEGVDGDLELAWPHARTHGFGLDGPTAWPLPRLA